MQGCVVDGRRVAVATLALVAFGSGFVVHAIFIEHVAVVTGDVLALRQPRFVVEHAAQRDLLGFGAARLDRDRLGKGFEQFQFCCIDLNRLWRARSATGQRNQKKKWDEAHLKILSSTYTPS